MSTRFAMTVNLDNLLHPEEVPPPLHELLDAWSTITSNDLRGTLLGDELASVTNHTQPAWSDQQEQPLPEPVYHLLSAWLHQQDCHALFTNRAYVHTKFERQGQRFQPFHARAPGNSFIVFSQPNQPWSAARTWLIFSHKYTNAQGNLIVGTYFVVEEFCPLSPEDVQYDPFRRFLHGGRLVYERCKPAAIIPISSVLGHCAYTAQGEEFPSGSEQYVHVLPLLKVRQPTLRSFVSAQTFSRIEVHASSFSSFPSQQCLSLCIFTKYEVFSVYMSYPKWLGQQMKVFLHQ